MLRLSLLITSLATLLVLPLDRLTGQNLLEGYTYRVIVRDTASLEPVPYPALKALNFEKGFVGNERGLLEFNWPEPTLLVEFSALGYATTTYLLRAERKSRTLKPKVDNDLPTVVVSSEVAMAKMQRTSQDNYLATLLTTWGDELVVIYRRGLTKDYRITRYAADGQPIETIDANFPNRLVNATTTCADRLYLVTGVEAIVFDRENGQMEPVEKLHYADYQRLFASCRLKYDNKMIFERSKHQGLLRKTVLHRARKGFKELYVYESPLLPNYFSEYYKIGYNLASALTMDTINGRTQENAYRRDKYQDALFLRDYIYVNKAEHYYFGGSDQLYFFDFSTWRLRTFDWNGKEKEVTPLPLKIGKKKVPQRVVYDAKKSRFYTYLDTREGFMLYEIDSESGQFAAVSQLPLREIRDLLVHNGRVYAIGKGDLDVQSNWRALYSASL